MASKAMQFQTRSRANTDFAPALTLPAFETTGVLPKHAATDPTAMIYVPTQADLDLAIAQTGEEAVNNATPTTIAEKSPAVNTPVTMDASAVASSSDHIAPVIIGSLDDKSGVLSNGLRLNFNEAIQLGSGAIQLHNYADGSVVESFVNGVGSEGG